MVSNFLGFVVLLTFDQNCETVSSHDRHFRYCTRSIRSRPRSCQACNIAKTKCSFEEPCSRCVKRGIECIYTGVGKGFPVTVQNPAPADPTERSEPSEESGNLPAFEALQADSDSDFPAELNTLNEGQIQPVIDSKRALPDDVHVNTTHFQPIRHNDCVFTDDADIDDAQFQLTISNKRQAIDFTFDELLPFQEDALGQYEFTTDVGLSLQHDTYQQDACWCSWMHGDVTLAGLARKSTTTPNDLAVLRPERPHAYHVADLIVQSLRAFPTMMLRRETFPWFIHPQAQRLVDQSDDRLPQALVNCMGIAQMFASRTPETRHILRQSIKTEYHQFLSDVRLLAYNVSTPC